MYGELILGPKFLNILTTEVNEMATEINTKVLQYVTKALKRNPDTPNQKLFEHAKEIDPSIGDLDMRQFNARYPLRVKRAAARAQAEEEAPSEAEVTAEAAPEEAPAPKRRYQRRRDTQEIAARVRSVLVEFAANVANATKPADLVVVMSDLDTYVDRLEDALAA